MSEPKHVYVTNEQIFYNSNCLFVEYNDVIKMPMYVLALIMKDNESMKSVFDMSELEILSMPEMYEWYINRKHINFLKDIPLIINEELLPDNFFDDTLKNLMLSSDELYSINSELSFADTLRLVVEHAKLVKRIIIYNETDNPFIRDDIENMYDGKVEFMFGDFKEVIQTVPKDSTYVFSDINKLNIMAELDRINLASFLIAGGYRYNQIDAENYKVDFEKLTSKFVFKYNFFDPLKLN